MNFLGYDEIFPCILFLVAGGLRNRSTDGDGGDRKRERRSNGESIGWNRKKINEMYRKRKRGRRE